MTQQQIPSPHRSCRSFDTMPFTPATVNNLQEAMGWCAPALAKADLHFGFATMAGGPGADIAPYIYGRIISTSGAFSGIGGPELADNILHSSFQQYLQLTMPDGEYRDIGNGDALRFRSEYAIEINKKSLQELLRLPGHYPDSVTPDMGPRHVFGDISQFCPDEVRPDFGLDGGVVNLSAIRMLLRRHRPKLSGKCVKHNQMCSMIKTCMHRAGSHCTMHSAFGSREGSEGASMRFFFLWCALRRELKDTIIIHENVKMFGTSLLVEEL
eukprot:3368663-Pyramimonas_sp.AAC.1